ncbi:MAG: T9SS type A sorting domain-containing protein [Flavobacteriales bacterium]|jgi:hypothetical protein|nr:T9SS type A sorting domain-containing protein [Flavobacteriales bacterium]
MKKITFLVAFLFVAFTYGQDVIVSWDFEDQTTNPTEGVGIISLIGDIEEPANPFPQGSGGTGTSSYSSTQYPEQGTNNGTAGFQFDFSTLTFTNITATFERRGSNTASAWEQYEYSIDNGNTWNVIGDNDGATQNAWPGPIEIVLPAGADNATNVSFRIVSIFEPSTTEYTAIGETSNYGVGGTWRIDNVTFSGGILSLGENTVGGFSMYPNPTNTGSVTITTKTNQNKNVVVFDVLGKQVLSKKLLGNTLNVSSLKSGIYLVQVTEGNTTSTKKLIIK